MIDVITKKPLILACLVLALVVLGAWGVLDASLQDHVVQLVPWLGWPAMLLGLSTVGLLAYRHCRQAAGRVLTSQAAVREACYFYEWEGRCIGYHHAVVSQWLNPPANYNRAEPSLVHPA